MTKEGVYKNLKEPVDLEEVAKKLGIHINNFKLELTRLYSDSQDEESEYKQ